MRAWPARAAAWLLALAGVAFSLPAAAALDNAGCLQCHSDKSSKIEVPAPPAAAAAAGSAASASASSPAAKPRTLRGHSAERFATSVHGRLACTDCHTGVTDNPAAGSGHRVEAGKTLRADDCATCHQRLLDKAKADNSLATRPRLQTVVDNAAAYKKSFHALPDKNDKSRPKADCNNCHDTHVFDIPTRGSATHDAWRIGKSALTCGTECHSDALDEYKASIHGQEALGKKNAKWAVCIDCHSAHAIGTTSADRVKLAITANCGNCHAENYKSYKATYHGQISTLGYTFTAKCYDCHGSHTVMPASHKDSKVHPANRMETCQNCHGQKGVSEAPASFISFQPHARTDDFARYPQMWLAFKLMVGLLVGTFGFFWLHTAMWFYREWKERGQAVTRPAVTLAALPPGAQGKRFQRFSAVWRLGHLLFAVSLMLLTLTGMPLFYPDAAWAPFVMRALGGPHVAGLIHRVCAVVFAGVFFWHLFYMGSRIWRDRANFKLFGPDSMIPNLQDLQDIIAMFRWFLGQGPRPVFDRWTYWEKFDYWAPFWGVTIIGVSGLVMWLPHLTGSWLPGWVFNVAAIFHGEEAFLAVVFLFTVHFFNNHFRPTKFPLDTVMFTGSMSIEHFQREHPLQYQRLAASGELQKYLVDEPSPPMALGSKILGFTLIACGLVLLFGVAVGFFGGGG